MTLHLWWLFVAAVFLLSGTPGPNMLHVMTRSVALGFRRATAAMLGCLAAVCVALTASAAGLSAVLVAVPGAFAVLRIAGAAYLVWLGIRAWSADVAPIDVAPIDVAPIDLADGAPAPDPRASPLRLFRGGFAIGISNPKLLLFAAAFLPQFVNPAAPRTPQFALLIATFAVIECLWYAAYAAGGRSIARYLAAPGRQRLFNRLTGALFVGFGLSLLRIRPA